MNKGKNKVIVIEAPGRICLLGEHQDYLGLEVISGAMNLKVR
ncbi:MAG: galactokinase family protein, partial [bacterium]